MIVKLYLAGPMSNYPDFNYEAFRSAAAHLRGLGYEVANPAEINPDTRIGWRASMLRDIPHVLTADAIALLPDWQLSRGARLEVHIAQELGIPTLPVHVLAQKALA